jgi:hypothetical protein
MEGICPHGTSSEEHGTISFLKQIEEISQSCKPELTC